MPVGLKHKPKRKLFLSIHIPLFVEEVVVEGFEEGVVEVVVGARVLVWVVPELAVVVVVVVEVGAESK
jgi:hypothetical protein